MNRYNKTQNISFSQVYYFNSIIPISERLKSIDLKTRKIKVNFLSLLIKIEINTKFINHQNLRKIDFVI